MINHAAKFITEKIQNKYIPKIALILGSGLGGLADEIKNPVKIKYHEIPGFKQSSIDGHVGQLVIGRFENKEILIMQGRIHFYEGYSIQDIVFPIKVMKKLGIEKLIITNAAGGINENFLEGSYMLIKDHINFMGTNPLIGKNDNLLGTRFPDMTNIYDKEFLELAKECAIKANININQGVYLATCGPSYETPAEIKMFRTFGADAVGMSTVPEAIVANYCGIRVLGISCITNSAAGIKQQKLKHDEVMAISNKTKNEFSLLIKEILKKI